MSAIPTGNSVNMWVFVTVFGPAQWAVFLALLAVLAVLVAAATAKDVRVNDEEEARGSASMRHVVQSSILTALLFSAQMGEHPPPRARPAIRLLTLTLSLLSLLMFVYYTNDITATMTSGPPKVNLFVVLGQSL